MLRPDGDVVRHEAAVAALQLGNSGSTLQGPEDSFLVLEVGPQVDLELVDSLEVIAQLLLAEDYLQLRVAVGTSVVSV